MPTMKHEATFSSFLHLLLDMSFQ